MTLLYTTGSPAGTEPPLGNETGKLGKVWSRYYCSSKAKFSLGLGDHAWAMKITSFPKSLETEAGLTQLFERSTKLRQDLRGSHQGNQAV